MVAAKQIVFSSLLSGKVESLKSNTVYEVEVCAVCGDQRSEYSNRLDINTRQNTSFKCGQVDSSKFPSNRNPLRKLVRKDVFKAYGFDVEVAEATGGAGTYTGKGYVLIPLLNFIKIEVTFNNIQINEEYELIGGEVKTVYNLKENPIVWNGDGPWFEDVKDPLTGDKEENKFNEILNPKVAVDSVKEVKIEGNKVVITDANGKKEEISTSSGQMVAVKTEEGKEYVVDTGTGTIYSSGNSGQKAPEGTPSGSVTTAAQAGKGASPKYNVSFIPHKLQEYGFDYPTDKSPAANYDQVEITGTPTLVPWKSLETGHIERLVAGITGGPADSVRYYRESNNVVMTAPEEGSNVQKSDGSNPQTFKQLLLNGTGKNDNDKLFAWYAACNGDTAKTYNRILAGQLNTVSYEKVSIKVVLVPVNNSSCPEPGYVKEELNKIYKSAVVNWDVQKAGSLKVTFPGTLFDNTDDDDLMDYTADMKVVISAFKDDPTYSRETYYLFFLDDAKDQTIKGYMPLKKQFGFIFKYKQYPDEYLRTVAHELGHGSFRLWHTFSNNNKYVQSRGTTDNLMDYADARATALNKYQWDWVHDPEWRLYWFTEEDEAKDISLPAIAEASQESKIDWNGSITCVTPGGVTFTLPDDVMTLSFIGVEGIPNGVLTAFTTTNEEYRGLFNTKTMFFRGYSKVINKNGKEVEEICERKDNDYVFYPDKKTPNTNVYLGIRENCVIALKVIPLSKLSARLSTNQTGEGKIENEKIANYISSTTSNIKTIQDPHACFKTQTAKDFYNSHTELGSDYQVVISRIAQLMDKMGDDMFKAYEKYANTENSYHHYYDSEFWGVNLSDYLVFEEALDNYINSKEKLEKIIDETEDAKLIARIGFPLVFKYGSTITYKTRLKMLNYITHNSGAIEFWLNHYADLVVDLLVTIPSGEQQKKIVDDYFKTESVVWLYSKLHGNNISRVNDIILSLFESYYGKGAIIEAGKKLKSDKIVAWQNPTDGASVEFSSALTVKNGIPNVHVNIDGFIVVNDRFRVPDHNGDEVDAAPFEIIGYFPVVTSAMPANIRLLPAIYVYGLLKAQNEKENIELFFTALNAISFTVGIGELMEIVTFWRIMQVAVPTVGMVLSNQAVVKKIESLKGGKEFLLAWKGFDLVFNFVSIRAAVLDRPLDAIKLTKHWRNVKNANAAADIESTLTQEITGKFDNAINETKSTLKKFQSNILDYDLSEYTESSVAGYGMLSKSYNEAEAHVMEIFAIQKMEGESQSASALFKSFEDAARKEGKSVIQIKGTEVTNKTFEKNQEIFSRYGYKFEKGENKYTFTLTRRLSKIDLLAEEALGGHSIARHGAQLSLAEMEERVLGTHPTIPQSRSALRFESESIHENAVDKAYAYYAEEIETYFKAGGDKKEWTFDYGSNVGRGFTNIGTLKNPVSQAVSSNKVTIIFVKDASLPRGYKLLTAYPDIK